MRVPTVSRALQALKIETSREWDPGCVLAPRLALHTTGKGSYGPTPLHELLRLTEWVLWANGAGTVTRRSKNFRLHLLGFGPGPEALGRKHRRLERMQSCLLLPVPWVVSNPWRVTLALEALIRGTA